MLNYVTMMYENYDADTTAEWHQLQLFVHNYSRDALYYPNNAFDL